ncbi:unnamed protein product [Cyclocybe aegerita]|uniref:HIT-type domain-containing protein n=1 Tax=Cyclocybe aegerita TaxID=1973307 RepID=A0A8S0X4G9_CYCAE|nr:unnamed protein product [Cyclocybe aegerita]
MNGDFDHLNPYDLAESYDLAMACCLCMYSSHRGHLIRLTHHLSLRHATVMPPKKGRTQLARQKAAVDGPDPAFITKRTLNHLDELERSNYAEATFAGDEAEGGGRARARNELISDKRTVKMPGKSPAAQKGKSTRNVRNVLVYRQTLAVHLEKSMMPPDVPSYLTAKAPPSPYPPRLICTVCGYWGAYKCRQCAMAYCDLNCQSVHAETRCEKRVV